MLNRLTAPPAMIMRRQSAPRRPNICSPSWNLGTVAQNEFPQSAQCSWLTLSHEERLYHSSKIAFCSITNSKQFPFSSFSPRLTIITFGFITQTELNFVLKGRPLFTSRRRSTQRSNRAPSTNPRVPNALTRNSPFRLVTSPVKRSSSLR